VEFPSARGAIGVGPTGDPRLWIPGTYTMRLLLSTVSGVQGYGREQPAELVSPAFRFVVEEPKGVDAEAWAALSAPGSKGHLLRGPKLKEVIDEYWTSFGTSRYAAYIAAAAAPIVFQRGGDHRVAESRAWWERSLTLDREGIMSASSRIDHAAGKSYAAGEESDVKSALEILESGRSELKAMAADERERPWMRAMAEYELRRMATPDEIRETVLRRMETKAANQAH
jgi:hypothetical protein